MQFAYTSIDEYYALGIYVFSKLNKLFLNSYKMYYQSSKSQNNLKYISG